MLDGVVPRFRHQWYNPLVSSPWKTEAWHPLCPFALERNEINLEEPPWVHIMWQTLPAVTCFSNGYSSITPPIIYVPCQKFCDIYCIGLILRHFETNWSFSLFNIYTMLQSYHDKLYNLIYILYIYLKSSPLYLLSPLHFFYLSWISKVFFFFLFNT